MVLQHPAGRLDRDRRSVRAMMQVGALRAGCGFCVTAFINKKALLAQGFP